MPSVSSPLVVTVPLSTVTVPPALVARMPMASSPEVVTGTGHIDAHLAGGVDADAVVAACRYRPAHEVRGRPVPGCGDDASGIVALVTSLRAGHRREIVAGGVDALAFASSVVTDDVLLTVPLW